MTRQQGQPLLLTDAGSYALPALSLGAGPDQISEGELQLLLHTHPECLPITEIDPIFAKPVPLCTELSTPAGSIDNVMVTATGLPILIECKLWRNPEARREVVGQIIDYAKELTRWSASDLQREVARRVERPGNPIIALLEEAGYSVDETAFNDALTHNLRRGRFLLLIVGDGIREGVEAIAEYLQTHAGLHFSLGLVELPIYVLGDGHRLVVPRVLARTELIQRQVVALPSGMQIADSAEEIQNEVDDENPVGRVRFWKDFVAELRMDDPEQSKPRAGKQGYVSASLPVPNGSAWILIYRNEVQWKVGIYLSYTRDSAGARVVDRLLESWAEIEQELGGTAILQPDKLGRRLIQDSFQTGPWTDEQQRARALTWLRTRTNDFVNILRPRIKTVVSDLGGDA